MAHIDITEDLLIVYLSGNATLEETYAILKARKTNPEIALLLDIAERNLTRLRLNPNPLSIPVSKLYAFNSRHLPVMRMAASSEANDCVIKCEQHVLEKRGLQSHYKKLIKQARRNNWLQSRGTPLYNIGRLLELAGLSVARQFGGTLDRILNEINEDCSVIVVLNIERLQRPGVRTAAICNHAVEIVEIDTEGGYVEIFDPQSPNETDCYAIDDFLRAWKPSKNYFVSIIERGVRPYTPHPEYVAHIKLPEEISSIADMLAENAHEIWAKGRLIEAEKKIAKGKNIDPYKDPFMKPFRELSKQKRKTDYTSALNSIKLLYKLGFKITDNGGKQTEYKSNVRTADGRYIPKPIPVDDVVLPEEIARLTEYIAENAHEEWAKQRFKEGWVFAPKTNKKLKMSFDLVPYCELLDSEKEYDRKMAMNTLRVLYKLGYKIEKGNR